MYVQLKNLTVNPDAIQCVEWFDDSATVTLGVSEAGRPVRVRVTGADLATLAAAVGYEPPAPPTAASDAPAAAVEPPAEAPAPPKGRTRKK